MHMQERQWPRHLRKVLWEVDNSTGILEPQTYGGVSFKARRSHDALVVPLSAMTNGEKNEVFVVKPDNTVERRPVKAGTDDGTYIEILSGLSEGEIVVTSGTEGLSNGEHAEVVLDEMDKGSEAR